MRKRLALACGPVLALFLAGCGDTPVAEALRVAAPAAETARPLPPGPLLLASGGRRPLVFTLVQETGSRRLWRAEGGVALATEGPRITATAGLGQMLAATRQEGADPLEDPLALLARSATTRRTVDMQGAGRDPSSMRFGLLQECRLSAAMEGSAVVVREVCTGPGGGFTNRFWADPTTGAIQRSEQWVGDEMPALTVEMRGV